MTFIFLSLTAVIHTVVNGRTTALSLHDYINAFRGFEVGLQPTLLDNLFHFLPLALTLVSAFFFYRPFCCLVCPIGLITNVVEQTALLRVVRGDKVCDDCGTCVAQAPCPAVAGTLKDAVLRSDCFSCNRCVKDCRRGALEFGLRVR
mgnify:CR=1 FL=1